MAGVRLDNLIRKNLYDEPGEPCVMWHGAWWSRGALEEMIELCEDALRECGFKEGYRLGVILPNSPLFLAAAISAWRLGGAIVPLPCSLSPQAAYKDLAKCGVCGALVSPNCPDILNYLNANEIPAMSCSGLSAMQPLPFKACSTQSPDIAGIFHTSGTTGPPKPVPLTHEAINFNASSCARHITDLSDEEIVLNSLPNNHILGFSLCAVLPLLFNYPQIILPSFRSAKATLNAMKKGYATAMITVPAVMSLLAQAVEDGEIPCSSLKLVFCGGYKLSPELLKKFSRAFGVGALEGYGLTETASVLCANKDYKSNKPGTVGKPLAGMEIKIIRQDGQEAQAGEQGRLWVRGPGLASSYFGDLDMTNKYFKDGWFDTQDTAQADEEGYITIAKRPRKSR